MKILKHKNITGIILGLLLLMPFLSILARSAYVVVNKNAYQSYSDIVVENTKIIDSSTTSLLSQGSTYTYTGMQNPISLASGNSVSMYFTWSDSTLDMQEEFDLSYACNGIGISTDANNTQYFRLYFYDTLNESFTAYSNNVIYYSSDLFTTLNNMSFTFTLDTFATSLTNAFKIQYIIYSKNGLDNVFEYSVSNFVEDNNIGNLDLTSWFFDIFLEDNSVNNLYVNFANWYMNYAMLITLMHFLFLVLMWFINYSRRLLDRGMNYDW